MKANARSPCAIAVLRSPVDIYRRLALKSMTDQLPMHQVFGVQNRQPWNGVETRCNHVIVIAYSNGIGIGIIGVENGILIASIPGIRVPHL